MIARSLSESIRSVNFMESPMEGKSVSYNTNPWFISISSKHSGTSFTTGFRR